MKAILTLKAMGAVVIAFCIFMPMSASSEPALSPEPDKISGVSFAQTGSYVEHTPSIVQCSNGSFFLAYESATSISGKFTINMTWSTNGITWAPDWVAITSAGTMGNRHPTIIQRNDGQLMMAYFSDRTGAYRVYTATSANGRSWSESGALALQNPAVNPFLIKRAGGGYAMSYQRYGSASDGSYFASSADGTVWSAPSTRVTSYSLPRLCNRLTGGFMMTYQGGTTGSTFDIRYRTSADGTTWSSETRLTYTGNSHDSFPLVLANNTYMVFFSTYVTGRGYDLYRKWSQDLSTWSGNEYLESFNVRYDTEAHPCQLGSNQTILLSWGYESSGATGGYENVDIALVWIEDIPSPPTFDIPLSVGWNLVSIPLELADTSVETALISIAGHYTAVKHYDETSKSWKTHRPGSSMDTLADIDHTMGLWVNANSSCILSVSGSQPATTEIQLKAGWNLVGYPSGTPRLASVTFPAEADMVSVYQAASPYVQDHNDMNLVTMSAGNGYWVRVTADCTWVVPW